ncbi:MAG: bifunctional [glutamine synthetase] adenylyltransferase/[glutamine synthetase]-adenylyl-L-tyrosine phosphorylase [Actinomycetota bacterium]
MQGSDLRVASTTAIERVSRTLSEFLQQDERAAQLLDERELPDAAGYRESVAEAVEREGMSGLRVEKRRRLLQVAAHDACGRASLEEVGHALSDLADACLQCALKFGGATDELAVVGMGKLGARELNYVSDIDVMFVASGDVERATKVASTLLADLGANSPEGQAYAIDANLRPQGRAGALVRSLEAFLEHYRRWAQTWEFQALLKARACAGDLPLGQALVDQTRTFVFPQEVGVEHIENIRKMKERVERHVLRTARRSKSREADDVKLGPGGIRDIEFSVQLLQLVHGSNDPSVRAPATMEALLQLVAGGYIAEDDAAGLSVAYRWLRNVEHRLQLRQERRVRMLPAGEGDRSEIARAMGFRDAAFESALDRFDAVHQSVLGDVRGRFEKLFYRPMIESLAEGGEAKLTEEALGERLRVLGYRDVKRAARTLSGLVAGTSRRAKLLRLLAPAQLRWLASSPSPDEGLFGFLRVSESLGGRLDALGLLRDNPPGLEFLAKVLGNGRLLSEILSHVPEELSTIADPRGPGKPKQRARLVREARASLEWREPERRLDGLRRFKRREMLRVALSDLAGEADVVEVGWGLADLADACLESALDESEIPFAVIGMGKLGGRELNYSSDIDVMFVHDGDAATAERIAEGLLRSIGEVTPEGQAFRIDAALRPEGKSGPLARSIDSFLEYYERWARPWEHQALIRARVAAGNEDVGRTLIERTRQLAYPEQLSAEVLAEIRHLKARMERERIPRGIEPRRHFKMGPGGTADIEFSVQSLQLRHGHEAEELRVAPTLDALTAAEGLGLMPGPDAHTLRHAYMWLSSLRNRLFFLTGRPTDVLPVKPEDLEALGIAMGYTNQPRQELEEEYLRVTRRTRSVAERYVFG